MKRKVLALFLTTLLCVNMVACGEKNTTQANKEPVEQGQNDDGASTEQEQNDGNENQQTGEYVEEFSTQFSAFIKQNGEADAVKVLEAIEGSELLPTQSMIVEVEEGLLTGFGNTEIKGFTKGNMLAPMIGTIPFVAYSFETEDAHSAEALAELLKENADLRWNICTEAAEKICNVVDNKVYFAMIPASFDEE